LAKRFGSGEAWLCFLWRTQRSDRHDAHRIGREKRWIDNARFLHALNFCMLLPGPEAQQLAIYIGWLLHKTRAGS